MLTYVVQNVTYLTRNTLLLTLRSKRPGRRLQFVPGQYAAITAGRGLRQTPARCFSIVSSPFDDTLQFAMRVQGSFTTSVAALRPGDEVRVRGPFGEFFIDEQYDRNVVFLAGGIGITPFISMLRALAASGSQLSVTLLYSCRTADDVAFADELLALQAQLPNFRVVFFVSRGEPAIAGVPVVRGRITEQHLRRITGGQFNHFTFFMCGPSGFIQSMQETLRGQDVIEDRLITEAFALGKPYAGAGPNVQKWTYGFAGGLVAAGVVGIMALDLIGSVPKLVAAQVRSVTSSSGTSGSNSTGNSSSANTSSTSTAQSSAQAPTTVTQTQVYQQPISSVS